VVSKLRATIVHERFTEPGGSEKVVDAFATLWPNSTLFAPLIDPALTFDALKRLPHQDSWLQSLYRGQGRYSHLLPMLPAAMKRARLPWADVVIISHHAFANRVRPPARIPVVSYVHTPARWIWDSSFRKADAPGPLPFAALEAFAVSQRRADRAAAQRPDILVANSTEVARRIRRWWGRDSIVVHPPVAVHRFAVDSRIKREDFFLLAGRLVPYKKPEIAVAAATRAGVPLVVVGDGRARERCEKIAGPKVKFLGSVSDQELANLYRRCKALVFPGVEDFGIVPVEAQAAGAPVIALDAGGVKDTVIQHMTGTLLANTANSEELISRFAKAMGDVTHSELSPRDIAAHAAQFSERNFADSMNRIVNGLLDEEVIDLRDGSGSAVSTSSTSSTSIELNRQ